jgi:DNA modification methylase
LIKIIYGDFRNYTLPQGVVITDPPYNQGYHYESYNDNLTETEYIQLLSFVPSPCVFIHYPEETINIIPKTRTNKCEEVVFWVYPSNTGKQSRSISWWGLKPDMDKLHQPYKNANDKRIKQLVENGREARMYDWWEVNQVKNVSNQKEDHPCQIPEEIIRRIIECTTNVGDTIIDPFMGSGTTGAVAARMGRNYWGIEIDPKYFKIAQNRIYRELVMCGRGSEVD